MAWYNAQRLLDPHAPPTRVAPSTQAPPPSSGGSSTRPSSPFASSSGPAAGRRPCSGAGRRRSPDGDLRRVDQEGACVAGGPQEAPRALLGESADARLHRARGPASGADHARAGPRRAVHGQRGPPGGPRRRRAWARAVGDASTRGGFAGVVDSRVPHPTISEASAETEGEFIERLRDDGAQHGLIVIAPHGGEIELNTDRQAERLRSRLGLRVASAWRCKGWDRDGGPSRPGTSPPPSSTRPASPVSTV